MATAACGSYLLAFIIIALLVLRSPRQPLHRRRLSQPWLAGGHARPNPTPDKLLAPRVPKKPRHVDDDSAPREREMDDSEWTWSKCVRFFDERAAPRARLFPTVRFNGISHTDDVAAYTMQPHWPRPCVMRYFEMLKSCSRHHPGNSIQDCINLAPAGSGTTTLAETLQRARLPFCCPSCLRNDSSEKTFVTDALRARRGHAHDGPRGCYHHSHLFHLGAIQTLGARCAIMTIRDPVKRIESSFRWEFLGGLHLQKNRYSGNGRQSHQSDVNEWVTKQLDNGYNPSHVSFSFAHLKYLGGLSAETCAAKQFELHVLCSENLDDELARLSRIFPGADVRPHHAFARSDTVAGSWRLDAARLNSKVAARVNRLYREDRLIHDLLCANQTRYRRR